MGPKFPYLGVFGIEVLKTIVIFEICNLKFVKLQNLAKIEKLFTLGTKMPYLAIFGIEFWKAIVVFQMSTLKFVKEKEKKLPIFRTKNALLEYFPG